MAVHSSTVSSSDRLSILYVDDEEKSLKHFKNIFDGKFTVLTASSAREGLKVLEENKDRIGILMTDQRMPGEKGTQVLQKVRKHYPYIIRILISAYADIGATQDAVNKGGIYKYVRKPWDIPQLEITLMRGLAVFAFRKMRNRLVGKSLPALEDRVVLDHYRNLRAFTTALSRYLYDPVTELKAFIDEMYGKGLGKGFGKITSNSPGNWEYLLGHVSAQVDRVLLIQSRLLEASKKSMHEKIHQICIQNVVSQTIDQMQPVFKEKRIEIENNIPEDLPPIKGGPEMLSRLFVLLLEDELSSLPMGGVVRLSARSMGGVRGRPARLRIKIEDNGPGLREGSRDPVFEPFRIRSQDPKELGLNLWVSFFIVHYHGGKIEARNNLEGGTTFVITLPSVPGGNGSIQEDDDFFEGIVWNEAIWEYLLKEKFNDQLLECVLSAYQRDL